MKKLFILMALLAAAPMGAQASADLNPLMEYTLSSIQPLDLINWKVGDTAEYNISMGGFAGGKMKKYVAKDEGTALWLNQEMSLMGQNQKVETLISKADGKVLKMIVNGKEQAVPDDKPEIISQDYGEVTVPAGTFQAIHIVAKTKQVPKVEIWVNPRDTVMEGTIKQIAQTQLFPMTMELTSFKHGQ